MWRNRVLVLSTWYEPLKQGVNLGGSGRCVKVLISTEMCRNGINLIGSSFQRAKVGWSIIERVTWGVRLTEVASGYGQWQEHRWVPQKGGGCTVVSSARKCVGAEGKTRWAWNEGAVKPQRAIYETWKLILVGGKLKWVASWRGYVLWLYGWGEQQCRWCVVHSRVPDVKKKRRMGLRAVCLKGRGREAQGSKL